MISIKPFVKNWTHNTELADRINNLTEVEAELLAISELSRIQLDAFKAGMLYAAERVRRQPLYSDFSLSESAGASMMANKLKTSAEQLVETPNDVAASEASPDLAGFVNEPFDTYQLQYDIARKLGWLAIGAFILIIVYWLIDPFLH